jgi:hypothetical protein
MLRIQDGGEEHEKFKELCALAASGSLSPLELSELHVHLEYCESCREALAEYRILITEGIPTLAEGYLARPERIVWDDSAVREKLWSTILSTKEGSPEQKNSAAATIEEHRPVKKNVGVFAGMAIAAGILLAVASGAYHLGARTHKPETVIGASAVLEAQYQKLAEEKKAAEESLAAQEKRLAQLQAERSQKEQALVKLRATLQTLEARSNELMAASSQSESQLKELAQQRDELNAKLQAASQAYGNNQTELASLRYERDKTSLGAFLNRR